MATAKLDAVAARQAKVRALDAVRPDIAGRIRFLDGHVFIHTHVEKSGGSALANEVGNIVGWAQTMDTRLRPRLRAAKMEPAERDLLRFYTGHCVYGVHRHFAKPPLYIAALREPVSRAISHYRYLSARPLHPRHAAVKDRDLETAIEALHEAGSNVARNGQVARLAGTRQPDPETAMAAIPGIEAAYFALIPMQGVERFIRTLRQALDMPGTSLRAYNPNHGPKVEPTEAVRARIAARNLADTALYERAVARFDETLERVGTYIAEARRG